MSRSLMLLAVATSIVVTPAANGEAKPDPATRTMLSMRVAGAILTSYKDAYGKLPDLGSKPVEASRIVDELGTDLGTDVRKFLAATDGWGNPVRFIVTPDHYVIICFGADGREDVSYAELLSQGTVNVKPELAPDSPLRDIIFLDGEFFQRPHPKASPTKQAMADLRSIAVAIESFAVDTDKYPGPTKGLQTVDVLASALEPIYIRSLPRLDGWEHPYLVWSDTKTYFILCGGADGVLDRDYLAPVDPTAALAKDSSATTDPAADIVFSDGQFVRFPMDGERP